MHADEIKTRTIETQLVNLDDMEGRTVQKSWNAFLEPIYILFTDNMWIALASHIDRDGDSNMIVQQSIDYYQLTGKIITEAEHAAILRAERFRREQEERNELPQRIHQLEKELQRLKSLKDS